MKLVFKGVVQGVGFRPTVYRVAHELGLKGYVLNRGSEVEVVIDRDVDVFLNRLKQALPPIAQITDVSQEPDERVFSDFCILHSTEGKRYSRIPADIGICDDCQRELFEKGNRRFSYPFTNCTVCGARFSVITDVPYDRERTSMNMFPLCETCMQEYRDPANRRYHAQTISCPTCGPVYHLYDNQRNDLGADNAIERFAHHIDEGEIGVVKSWGGMHLCCILDELPRFRDWYHRPQKPFAVMVRDLAAARTYSTMTKKEEELLNSKNKPIVLTKKKKAEFASPGLNTIGIYLPYSGVHHLLFSYLHADALVMTSANIPGEPMIIDNDDAFSLNADRYLLHNRKIPNRTDDTVVRTLRNHAFFIRKSRGFVPDPLPVSHRKRIISVGAGENICGALSHENQVYATQYIGNSQSYTAVEFLEQSIRHLMTLTMNEKKIDAVAQDLHPQYETRRLAKRFAEEFSVPCIDVQHHWAHAASLLVDHGLDEGVVLTLDGLGYGTDGRFWGGEILASRYDGFERVGHLEYIPLLGGDQAALDPRRLVFAIFKKIGEEKGFSGAEADVLSKLMTRSPQSSSFGRVLDALSCHLGICMRRTYDGEPAMKLERYLACGKAMYRFDGKTENGVIRTVDLFRQLDEQMKQPLSDTMRADLAFSFVNMVVGELVSIAVKHAKDNGIRMIGVTGGVSYNVPIIQMIERQMKKAKVPLCVHNRVPNGDGGIAIGQNAVAGCLISK